MKEPIRILQVVTIMNLGGLENFIMNIYRNIDRSQFQFDFLVHRQERGFFDDEIEELGGRIFRFNPIRPTQFFKYKNELRTFFLSHREYKIIHSHLNENSGIILSVAKEMKIPVRIAHSHAKATAGPYKFLRKLIKKSIPYYSTVNLACSKDAGKWLFNSKKFEVFNNSIDCDKFKFQQNTTKNNLLRKSLNIKPDEFVLGLIARFSPTKNHQFLIEVFSELLKIEKKSKLILIGDGELKEDILNKVKKHNIIDSVIFVGNVSNPQDYLSIMDVFVLTSFYEGMPLSLIEAQCNGLPILMSDTIPSEIEITDLVFKESLNSSPAIWANKILHLKRSPDNLNRIDYSEIVKNTGFDVKMNSLKLLDLYKKGLSLND